LNSPTQRFFIALLPPQTIQTYVSEVQQIFAKQYNSRAALRSPPHITLQPPFVWAIAALPSLHQTLSRFASTCAPVPVTLSGFGCFAPRVIYVNVLKTPELQTLQKDLVAFVTAESDIADSVAQTRPFTPHITVGFQDLTRPQFQSAWSEFQHRLVEFTFTATHLTLLMHDGQQWHVDRAFPLRSGAVEQQTRQETKED